MNLEEFEWRCARLLALFRPARLEPSCLIFSAQQDKVSKDLQEKCEYHFALSKYFFLHFFYWPGFHLADYYFLFWMPFKKLWDVYSNHVFTLTTMQKDSDCQFQGRQNASKIEMVILLSIRMLCGIRRCCETTYENGVIVFYATSSFRMCMFQIFTSKRVRFSMWTKSLNPKLGAVQSCAAC